MEHLPKDCLQYYTALGAAVAFAVGFWKYLDARKREWKNHRFEQFHRVFEWVAGRTPDGNEFTETHQALAVYELTEFLEYREMSLPIVDYYLKQTVSDPDDSLFRTALLFAAAKLKRSS